VIESDGYATREKGQHPTAKPAELYKWLLERYCPEGGTMLDPTAGSFNSCFVAKELGLKSIGIEKDAGFFWKAVSRSFI
jgi:DNA modification methylase